MFTSNCKVCDITLVSSNKDLFPVVFVTQFPASREQESESEAWVNALLGRIFWDFLGEKYWADMVSKKIQKKLSKIRVSTDRFTFHTRLSDCVYF